MGQIIRIFISENLMQHTNDIVNENDKENPVRLGSGLSFLKTYSNLQKSHQHKQE